MQVSTQSWKNMIVAIGMASFILPASPAIGKRKRPKGTKVIKKIFHSKKRFGRKKKSKKRTKWIKVAVIKPSKMMAQILGKKIPVMCRLSKSNQFECQFHTSRGIFGNESTMWTRGKMRLKVNVEAQGISLELSNKWKKYIHTKKKRR